MGVPRFEGEGPKLKESRVIKTRAKNSPQKRGDLHQHGWNERDEKEMVAAPGEEEGNEYGGIILSKRGHDSIVSEVEKLEKFSKRDLPSVKKEAQQKHYSREFLEKRKR